MIRIARLLSVLAVGLLLSGAAQSQSIEPGQTPGRLPKRFQPLEKSNLWTLVSVLGNDQWVDGEIIGDVAVSKNGKWGLSASNGGAVRLWGDGGAVRLWDLETGDCIRILSKFCWHEFAVAFLQDEKHIIAAKWPGELSIIEIETGKLKRTIQAEALINQVAAIPGGNRIIYIVGEDRAYITDLEKNNTIKLELKKIQPYLINSISFPEDGKTVAMATHKKVDIFDPDTGKLLKTLEDFPGKITSFSFFKDGKKCLIGFRNGTVSVFDTQTWKMIHSFSIKSWDLHTVALTNDEKRVIAGFDHNTRGLFRLEDGREFWKEKGPSIHSCAMTPDGKSVFTGSAVNGVMLWDLETGKPRSHKQRELGTARPIGFLGDLIVTRGVDNPAQVNFWKPDGRRVRNFAFPSDWDTSDPYGFTGKIANGGRVLVRKPDLSSGILDLETNQIILLKNAKLVSREVFSKDLRWLYGSSGGTWKKWDVATGEDATLPDVFQKLEKLNEGLPITICYHFDSQKAARYYQKNIYSIKAMPPIGEIEFHDLATGKIIAVDSSDGLLPITFSDGGDLVLVDRNLKRGHELSLWDHETGQNIRNFKGFEAPLLAAVFSPSRRFVIALSKDTILKMFNTATGELVDQIDFQIINDFPATIIMSTDFKKMLIGTRRGLSLYFESKQPGS